MNCPVCYTFNEPTFLRSSVEYAVCEKCQTVYTTADITSITCTENDSTEPRNTIELNELRLSRVTKALGKQPQTVLDFGCGQGQLLAFLTNKGIQSMGVDKHTDVQLCDVSEKVDAIFMVEVLEHLSNPREIIKELFKKLSTNGVIYIETGFRDATTGLQDHYIDPKIGHITIMPIQSLKYILPNSAVFKVLNTTTILVKDKSWT